MINFRYLLRGTRRYTLAAVFIVFSIFLLGIISTRIIASKKAHSQTIMDARNSETAGEIRALFKEREQLLLKKHKRFTGAYTRAVQKRKIAGQKLWGTSGENGICYEVLQKDSIVAWDTDAPVLMEADVRYTDGRFFFYRSPLRVYGLAATKKVFGKDTLLLVTGLLFEEKNIQENKELTSVSFQAFLEDKFTTEIITDYTPFRQPTRDGRYFVTPLENEQGNKVGQITSKRISINNDIEALARNTANMQGILIVAGFILMGFAMSGDFKTFRYPVLKPFLYTVYFVVFRVLLFKLNFPSSLFTGELIEPAGFASQLGGGIVKSPVEFFITTSFFFICSVYAFFSFGKLIDGYKPHLFKRAGYIFYSAIPLYLLIIFASLRGIAASVKSVINDSTFRYFNEPVIIPSLPQLIMITGVLILVTAVLLLLAVIFRIHLRFAPSSQKGSILWFVLFEFIISLSLGAIFIKVQNEPLITYPVFAVFIFLLHGLFYVSVNRPLPLLQMVLICGLFGSVIGVALLNYFNSGLERDSLKTTIAEINRPGMEFLQFLAVEALSRAENNAELADALNNKGKALDAETYLIWNASALKQERVQSSLWLLDRSRDVVGSFSTGDSAMQQVPKKFVALAGRNTIIEPTGINNNNGSINISGIAPVTDDGVLLGYLLVSIAYKQGMLIEQNVSDLFKSSPPLINNLLSPADLNIFSVKDGDAENISGDFYPTLLQVEALHTGAARGQGEVWTEFIFNDENYVVYAQQTNDGKEGSLIAVALKEKKLEWSFFNFFKLFTVHAFIIFVIAGCSSLITIFRRRSLFITFRMQLLSGFLLVSIVPVIALAVFNRYATYEKSRISIRAALQANMAAVEKQAAQMPLNMLKDKSAKIVLEKSGIYCNVYEANKLTSSAMPYLYSTGILPAFLPYDADYNMNKSGLKEYFSSGEYGGKEYFSLYKKIKNNGRVYIVEANSLINPIPGQYSPVEVDVFLFGIYSLAVIIVIGFSSVIANRIASPVKQLTLATRSVAHGDLSVKLPNTAYGEMKELMNGFNTMTDELQRNQAELANLEREAAWKEFARQVAHEIKNPLTPMKLTMQQLVAAYKDKSPKFEMIFEKVSATVLHQIETLNAIASEFSHFARMPVMNIEKIDIIPIVHESVTLFQNEKIAITLHENTPASLVLLGDASHFRRMFINFFRNSIQAGATQITIGVQTAEGIKIIIADDGHGITPGNEQKIFESNFTTKSAGMGLGLKLSRRFVESLGGTIILKQTEQKGACFVISLPFDQSIQN